MKRVWRIVGIEVVGDVVDDEEVGGMRNGMMGRDGRIEMG